MACQRSSGECRKYRDALVAEYHKYPALPPVFDFMDNEAPDKVRKVKPVWTADGYILFWTAPKFKDEMNRPVQYVVYRFGSKEKVDIDDPSHIVAVTRNTSISCLMRMARRSTVMWLRRSTACTTNPSL